MIVYTCANPKWLEWIAPEEFHNEELFRIVIFYVFHSPCTGLSAMGKSLADYKWHKPWCKPYYLNKQLKQASSNFNLLFSAKSYDKMSEALGKADLNDNFPNDLSRERICIYNNENNQFMSVFYHIRNAFAHGRLNIVDSNGECVFVLEDIVPNKKSPQCQKVSARMILRRSTLLKWIDIIEAGECKYIKNEEKYPRL